MNTYMYVYTHIHMSTYTDTYTYICYSPKLPGDLKRNGDTQKRKTQETEVSRERVGGNENMRYRNI